MRHAGHPPSAPTPPRNPLKTPPPAATIGVVFTVFVSHRRYNCIASQTPNKIVNMPIKASCNGLEEKIDPSIALSVIIPKEFRTIDDNTILYNIIKVIVEHTAITTYFLLDKTVRIAFNIVIHSDLIISFKQAPSKAIFLLAVKARSLILLCINRCNIRTLGRPHPRNKAFFLPLCIPPISLYSILSFFSLLLYKLLSLERETNMSTQIDTDCCKMKSVDGYCPKPLEAASAFLSKKWTISLIITIGNFKQLRFNDLKQRLRYATAKILSERLKELEKEGIVQRRSYKEIPPRVEYALTKKGRFLMQALHPLIHWAEQR